MLGYLQDLLPLLISAAHVLSASAVTAHAVVRKRHVQSAIGWVGLAWLAPGFGALAYLLLGINRIHRRAVSMRLDRAWDRLPAPTPAGTSEHEARSNGAQRGALAGLERLGDHITGKALARGNRIEPLVDGDAAFPAMLDAIAGARSSITLITYIFDADETGRLFERALTAAVKRGVAVRVLIDAVGARYARPDMVGQLRRAGVQAAAFLPTRVPWRFRYANLRNHRKILVADGRMAFVGGTNIRQGHWLGKQPRHPASCLHFRVEGPVVAHLQQAFAMDWSFTTREDLAGDTWFPSLPARGPVWARGVADGPDEDLDKILELLLGALAEARERVCIVTPYFVLDGVLQRTLEVTAMRGVQVDVVLPEKSNLPLLDWAMAPQFETLLRSGCRVHLAPAPFDHSKLFVVDGAWALIGSTNWDPRSLRLNFEYNVECYDGMLGDALERIARAKIDRARHLHLDDVSGWPAPVRIRNGLVRLLSPYL